MIYITQKFQDEFHHIHNVWEVDCDNIQELYIQHMTEEASRMDLVINPYWLNPMDYLIHNSHLSKSDFNKKSKQWREFRRNFTIDHFIKDVFQGVKHEYKVISF